MDAAKIRLSKEEEELALNADWILTKNGILEKVKTLFAMLQERQQAWLKAADIKYSSEIRSSTGKISRGENYRGLPWLMLDQPRIFGKEDVLAVRTFFWWGNFFSSTLQLSGVYKRNLESRVIDGYDQFAAQDFFLCVHDDQWQHHFETDNYIPVADFSKSEFDMRVRDGSFIKLSKRISLVHWKEAGMNLEETFRQYFKLLAV